MRPTRSIDSRITGRSTRTRYGIAPQGVLVSLRPPPQCRCAPINSNVRPMRKHTVVLLLLVFAGSARASCDLAGTYVRVQQGLLPATLQLSQADGGVRLQLDAYGPRMYDGNPTTGSLEGLATVGGRNSACAAVFISTEDECSLKMTRSKIGVEIVQTGSCLAFGAGVESSGVYRKRNKP